MKDDWLTSDKVRIVYSFDKPGCRACLCDECGSSIKRIFILWCIPIKKYTGCINYRCKNFYLLNYFL